MNDSHLNILLDIYLSRSTSARNCSTSVAILYKKYKLLLFT